MNIVLTAFSHLYSASTLVSSSLGHFAAAAGVGAGAGAGAGAGSNPSGAAALIGNSAAAACGNSCGTSSITQIFHSVTTVLLFLIGSISVIMVIIGGLRYVLANGDSKAAESGRNTILYAVIGVILSIASYAIIAFVTSNFH